MSFDPTVVPVVEDREINTTNSRHRRVSRKEKGRSSIAPDVSAAQGQPGTTGSQILTIMS